jgi:hypothetical protein
MSSFFDRDANVYLTGFLEKKDVFSLIKTNKRLQGDLKLLPYKNFYMDLSNNGVQSLKSFICFSKGIEELTIDCYDFFQHCMINLPRLKKITIQHCNISDCKLLEIYSSTLREIVINNCTINNQTFDPKSYNRLLSIANNPYNPKNHNINSIVCNRTTPLFLQSCCTFQLV